MINLLREIQAVDFTIYDLSLFLDTHPECRRALEDHNKFVQKSAQLKSIYEQRYGPLKLDSVSKFPYRYINDPWPWEIKY